MKKSLQKAHDDAQAKSLEVKDLTVYVMDKRRGTATITCNEWVHTEMIHEGYHTVTKYRNGKEVLLGK